MSIIGFISFFFYRLVFFPYVLEYDNLLIKMLVSLYLTRLKGVLADQGILCLSVVLFFMLSVDYSLSYIIFY